MKALIPIGRNLPVVQILEVGSMILNHSAKMKQIKNQYRLAKNEMNNQYRLQKQSLDNDLHRFNKMAKLQAQKFQHNHLERMQMMQMMSMLVSNIANAIDYETQQGMKEVLQLLIEQYDKSRENIDFLQTQNTPYLTQGER
ncbi:MAG: hypothetical protein DRG27_05640 [Deltaproteobacteria bacterium]|nr:MAG: hypothetical protein DRG27_05640 [Deltaproteobacteria bacterium]